MNIIINSRHLDITEAIRKRVEDKVSSALSLYENVITSVRVLLEKENTKNYFSVDVSVHIAKRDLIASASGAEFYAVLDEAIAKLETQAVKTMDKIRSHQAEPLRDAAEKTAE